MFHWLSFFSTCGVSVNVFYSWCLLWLVFYNFSNFSFKVCNSLFRSWGLSSNNFCSTFALNLVSFMLEPILVLATLVSLNNSSPFLLWERVGITCIVCRCVFNIFCFSKLTFLNFTLVPRFIYLLISHSILKGFWPKFGL